MSYRIDARTQDDLVAHVERAAADLEVPHVERLIPDQPVVWSEVLSADEVSAGLIRELLRGHHSLLDHAASLPDRAARHWLETTSGIASLDPAPATAVVVAEVADGAGPVLVDAGTELKGPKDAEGQASVFRTNDRLIATGARLTGLCSYGWFADRDVNASSSGEAFLPFAGDTATHEMYFCSNQLRFDRGTYNVTLEFDGDTSVGVLSALPWEYSTADGPVEVTARPVLGNSRILRFTLTDSCQPLAVPTEDGPVDHCWLRVSNRAFNTAALNFSFDSVTIVGSRRDLLPDSAWYNDGSLDIEREFKPFGDVPRRGDSFFVQSNEAFSKSLDHFDVVLAPLNQNEFNFQFSLLFPHLSGVATDGLVQELAAFQRIGIESEPDSSVIIPRPFIAPSVTPTIEWQIREDDQWREVASFESLTTATDLAPSRPGESASDFISLGGVEGRFARAFLRAGDFGWDAYQQGLIDFANHVAGTGVAASAPTPPKPPTLNTIRLNYTTTKVTPDRIVTVNGHHRRTITDGVPFAHPITTQIGSTPAAAIYVGLDLPDAVLGQTLSTWFQMDSTAACAATTTPDLSRWEVWTDAGWQRVAASDGSSFLRTSGLVRFVTPFAWPTGCPEAGATDGRWFRLATNQADRIGAMEAVLPDAVLAVARPTASDAVADLTAPDAESVKGPTTRIAGVKKLTNPMVGNASRAAESDETYLRRAPQVTRTRNRLIQPVDYELSIRADFPEVGFVSARPHFDGTDAIAPGHVGIVVIPDTDDPAPLPTADLVGRIEASVVDRAPIHATVTVHCPSYRRIRVSGRIVLTPGVAALSARAEISSAIDAFLHPRNRAADALGRPLYRSELIVLLEAMPTVDRLESLDMNADDGAFGARGPTGLVERIDPPTPRQLGMIVSSGLHDLELQETLS